MLPLLLLNPFELPAIYDWFWQFSNLIPRYLFSEAHFQSARGDIPQALCDPQPIMGLAKKGVYGIYIYT